MTKKVGVAKNGCGDFFKNGDKSSCVSMALKSHLQFSDIN